MQKKYKAEEKEQREKSSGQNIINEQCSASDVHKIFIKTHNHTRD